jgi:phage-related minor tail protein
VEIVREELNKTNSAREELRKTLLETTSDLKQESERFNKVVLDLEGLNRDL